MPEKVKHMRGNDAGISTVTQPYAIFPDNESTGLGRIMRRGKRFDQKIADLKPLVIPAYLTVDRFIGCTPVVEKIMERPFRCMDRDVQTTGKHVQTPYMVTVLMGNENRMYLPGIKRRVLHSLSLIHISEPTRRTPISYAVF